MGENAADFADFAEICIFLEVLNFALPAELLTEGPGPPVELADGLAEGDGGVGDGVGDALALPFLPLPFAFLDPEGLEMGFIFSTSFSRKHV